MAKQITLPVFDTACCAPLADAVDSGRPRGRSAPGDRSAGVSLIASSGGEVCVCELTGRFEVTGPTISHHLKVLREAGLIDGERRGTWVYYRVRPAVLDQLAGVLQTGRPAAAR